MPSRHLVLCAEADRIETELEQIRAELKIPGAFPADVVAEAERAVADIVLPDRDLTDVPFVTIDPASSLDLDQAVHVSRSDDGYLVRYAIADVAAFVAPGEALDVEAQSRGQSLYGPDVRTPLHPTLLSEGGASLLPGVLRPAIVWEVVLDHDGEPVDATVARATVRSRAKLSYQDVQTEVDAGRADESLRLLARVGKLRLARERDRGGVSLPLPEQDIVTDDGGYRLEFRSPLTVEAWNAQISLLTGIVAARMMRDTGIGIVRTLPPAQERDIIRLRRTARALRVRWPDTLPYAELIPRLDPTVPRHAAFFDAAAMLFRGAGYVAYDGTPPDNAGHAAIAAEYAHVTAPLRRLVDRYGLEICLAASAGEPVPGWVRQALPSLPETMADSGRRAGSYEAQCVNLVEAAVLTGHEGEVFDGVIVEYRPGDKRGDVVLSEAGVQGRIDGDELPVGRDVRVRLLDAVIEERRVRFELADA